MEFSITDRIGKKRKAAAVLRQAFSPDAVARCPQTALLSAFRCAPDSNPPASHFETIRTAPRSPPAKLESLAPFHYQILSWSNRSILCNCNVGAQHAAPHLGTSA